MIRLTRARHFVMTFSNVTGPCTALPPPRLIPYVICDEQFPVSPGKEIELSCYEGFELLGDMKMTCYSGTHFEYSGDYVELPKCTPDDSSGNFKSGQSCDEVICIVFYHQGNFQTYLLTVIELRPLFGTVKS